MTILNLGSVPPEDTVVPAAFSPSAFTQRFYNRLPGAYRAVDTSQTLYKWLAGMGDTAGELETLLNRFQYIDPADGGPVPVVTLPLTWQSFALLNWTLAQGLTWAVLAGGTMPTPFGSTCDLVNPATADPGWYPWLAQVLDVQLGTNDSLGAQLAKLENAPAGWQSCTVNAITQVAQAYLLGAKQVFISQQVADQWHFTVSVYAAQLQGQTYGLVDAQYATYALLDAAFAHYGDWTSSVVALNTALLAEVPAGMVLTLTVLSSAPYSVVDSGFTPYSVLDSHFAHYSDLDSYIP